MAAIIEIQVQAIRNNVIEMMALAKKQVERSQEAILTFNQEITEEIIATEKKINSLDLKIDSDCEQTLALYNPVADDLRLIISVLNINTFLERIGDNAESIAKFVNDFEQQFSPDLFEKLRLKEMFEHCIFMLDVVSDSFEEEDTHLAAKVFKRDKLVDEINDAATRVIADAIRADLENTENYLRLISIVRKIERVGDLVKNIAEETIFYVDAKVLKHKKKKRDKFISQDED